MTTAVAFPGMAPTPFADIAKFLLVNPHARTLLAEADEALGYDLFERFGDSDGSDYSEYAQVAFLVSCLAMAQWAAQTKGVRAEVCTGASFGSKAAAVHAGALSFADAVVLTAQLARVESEYFAAQHGDVVTQSFARTPGDVLAEIQAELDAEGEWHEVSCEVDHDVAMLSLRESRLDWLLDRLRVAGAMPLYTMRPPMHCGIFTGLRDRVAEELFAGLRFRDPVIPVVADQDGTVLDSADGVRKSLLDGFVRPVRWPQVVTTLRALGVTSLYVAGPDRLFGRVACVRAAFDVSILAPRLALLPRSRPALT